MPLPLEPNGCPRDKRDGQARKNFTEHKDIALGARRISLSGDEAVMRHVRT
jgi:hypothetical protein